MASWEDFSRIIAEAKESKKLDPVGKEDADVNNNGIDNDKSDQYLRNRRSSVGAAIAADRKKKPMVKISVPEKKLGYKVADIGPGGKEHNVKTYGNYKESLDPVGQEDVDIDNDDKKNTKSDKYLLNRRKVRSKVIEGASTKVDMGGPKVGCDDPDPRSMKTTSNLVKTKLRLMGLRPLVMSNEPEGEIVEGKKKDSSYLETDMKKRRENNEKAIEDMKKTKAHADMVKSARKAMGVDEEFVGEDKEYRREMAKASARERAEEKRSDNEWRKTKPGEKKSLKLSTTPHTKSVVKDYVDQEMGKIKYMDKVTKKNKNVVGLVTKEEFSLVDMMIAQFSPLNEAPENTIPGGKRRRGLSKTIQSRQVDKLADEGDYERADKLQDVSSVKLKKNKSQPTASKSPESKPEKKQESTSKKETAGKSTATERAARTTASARIRAARIARETEKEKREYKEKIRQEKKSEQQAGAEDRRKSAEEKQQKLKEIEKGKRADSAERSAQKEYDDKQSKKEKFRKEIGAATQIKSPDVASSKESDAKAVGPAVQAAGQIAAIPFKLAGVALKNANLRRKEKQREKTGKEAKEKSLKDDSQNESFCNWREEFILEVDDQVANPDQKKIIDVSKKKNKIEINPKIDEAAPLIPIIARLAGGMTSRAVSSKLAGTAAKGSLRSKAAEFAANKAGNFAANTVQDKLGPDDESRNGGDIRDKLTSGAEGLLSFLMPRSKVNEAAAWTKKSGKLQAAD